MRTRHRTDDTPEPPSPIPFREQDTGITGLGKAFSLTALPDSAEEVLVAIEDMSRRIDDLARELNCLGYFDDDDDEPRAA